MNILLFLNKIKIVALSSAKVITKYAFFFFFYCLLFGIAAQGKFIWEARNAKRLSALVREHLGYLHIQTEEMFVSAPDQ